MTNHVLNVSANSFSAAWGCLVPLPFSADLDAIFQKSDTVGSAVEKPSSEGTLCPVETWFGQEGCNRGSKSSAEKDNAPNRYCDSGRSGPVQHEPGLLARQPLLTATVERAPPNDGYLGQGMGNFSE